MLLLKEYLGKGFNSYSEQLILDQVVVTDQSCLAVITKNDKEFLTIKASKDSNPGLIDYELKQVNQLLTYLRSYQKEEIHA